MNGDPVSEVVADGHLLFIKKLLALDIDQFHNLLSGVKPIIIIIFFLFAL